VPLLESEVKGLSRLRQLGRVLYDSVEEGNRGRTS
jgi:hypothetical protein